MKASPTALKITEVVRLALRAQRRQNGAIFGDQSIGEAAERVTKLLMLEFEVRSKDEAEESAKFGATG